MENTNIFKPTKTYPSITAGTVFTVISAAHWVRYFRADEAIIAGYIVPVWWSLILSGVILALAVWMFLAARGSG